MDTILLYVCVSVVVAGILSETVTRVHYIIASQKKERFYYGNIWL
jgi:hypothetical protein